MSYHHLSYIVVSLRSISFEICWQLPGSIACLYVDTRRTMGAHVYVDLELEGLALGLHGQTSVAQLPADNPHLVDNCLLAGTHHLAGICLAADNPHLAAGNLLLAAGSRLAAGNHLAGNLLLAAGNPRLAAGNCPYLHCDVCGSAVDVHHDSTAHRHLCADAGSNCHCLEIAVCYVL